MSGNITITYGLNPPADTSVGDLSATKTHRFPVTGDGIKAYYNSVRDGLAKGKEVIGEELTAWRDAVGDREQSKESKRPQKGREEEEEDGEEE